MADSKISDLADGTTPSDTDEFVVARAGGNKKLTWAELKSDIPAGVSNLIDLADVTGTDGAGKAPVSDGADTFTLTDIATQAELDTHAADTTSVHGITDTSALYQAGGTDVAVADGGTGASNASGARTNLGLVIGTDVRAQGSGDPTRASLGLDTTDSPQFAGVNIGAAADTTVTRTGAGDIAVEGNAVYRAGGTDVPVTDGGTGASTAAAARTNLGVSSSDGWTDDTANTWTYASATTFTCAGVDRTSVFTVGVRLRLKQGGSYKYFVVVSSAFSTDTTVTVTGGTDYTLANASITDNYYSYAGNPQGYPGWFNYNCSPTGFSSFSSQTAVFSVVGRTCTVSMRQAGTSNATTKGASLPIACAFADVGIFYRIQLLQDSGAQQTGRYVLTDTTTIRFDKVIGAANGWTASGSAVIQLNDVYQI